LVGCISKFWWRSEVSTQIAPANTVDKDETQVNPDMTSFLFQTTCNCLPADVRWRSLHVTVKGTS
jgi:hypothetical protein